MAYIYIYIYILPDFGILAGLILGPGAPQHPERVFNGVRV